LRKGKTDAKDEINLFRVDFVLLGEVEAWITPGKKRAITATHTSTAMPFLKEFVFNMTPPYFRSSFCFTRMISTPFNIYSIIPFTLINITSLKLTAITFVDEFSGDIFPTLPDTVREAFLTPKG